MTGATPGNCLRKLANELQKQREMLLADAGLTSLELRGELVESLKTNMTHGKSPLFYRRNTVCSNVRFFFFGGGGWVGVRLF